MFPREQRRYRAVIRKSECLTIVPTRPVSFPDAEGISLFPAFRRGLSRRFHPAPSGAWNPNPFLRRINPYFFAISVCILGLLILYYIDCSCSFPSCGKEELHLRRPLLRAFRVERMLSRKLPCGRTNIRKNTDMSAVNRMSSRQMPHGIGVFASPRPSSDSAAFNMKQPLSGSRIGTQPRTEAGSTKVPLLRQANMDVSALMLAIFVTENTFRPLVSA